MVKEGEILPYLAASIVNAELSSSKSKRVSDTLCIALLSLFSASSFVITSPILCHESIRLDRLSSFNTPTSSSVRNMHRGIFDPTDKLVGTIRRQEHLALHRYWSTRWYPNLSHRSVCKFEPAYEHSSTQIWDHICDQDSSIHPHKELMRSGLLGLGTPSAYTFKHT